MLTVIVIPCLNERTTIGAAARSLGFGIGEKLAPANTILVLIDNASTDGTGAALAGIQEASRAGTVATTFEPERGYVPPRAKGLEIAATLASSLGYAADQTLILQADADSRYSEGYADAFREAAGCADRPTLFEALTKPPHKFIDHHPGFQKLADAVDAEMAPFLVDDTLDVVIDDKVCGYFLSDYRAWGGHRREYRANGKEIYAETSRLYMRGRHAGAQHVQITEAYAIPSRRKILRNPVRHFATAGFPRDESWWRAWSSRYDGPREIGAFEREDAQRVLAPAIGCRRAHLLAMMSLLPLVAAGPVVVADARRRAKLHPLVDACLSSLQNLPSNIDVPGLFEVAFMAIDAWQRQLKTSSRAAT